MKKNLIRICIVVIIVSFFSFSDWSFAEEGSHFEILGFSLNYIVSVLAWIWVFFAKLAGTFLTNKWVYGEVLGLDSLLWKFRNVVKNLANFGLGFYFVYAIFKGLIMQWQGKEDITKKLKDIILWLLIAGIGIQASWFFTAVVLDFSTVTLVAAGAFPSQIISGSEKIEGAMKQSLSEYLDPNWNYVEKGKRISIFSKEAKGSSILSEEGFDIVETPTFDSFVDALMPNQNDVSGPLYFMGFTILKTNVLTSIDSASEKGLKATILNTIIQGGTTIVFAIEMFVLCIIALMRIIYLWMFIVLSPLGVLIWCIEKSGEKLSDGKDKGFKGFLGKFTKQINFKTFFINVFKPTFIVLGIGVAVIFVSLMNKVVVDYTNKPDKPFDSQGVKFTSIKDTSTNTKGKGDQTYTTVLDNDILSFTLTNSGKTLLEIVLSVITVIIVYFIIRFAVNMGGGEDFLSKKVGNIQKGVGDLFGSVPVVPVAGYDKNGNPETHFISANRTFGLDGGKSLLEEKVDYYQRKVNDEYNKQQKIVESWFGNEAGFLSEDEKRAIERAGNTADVRGLAKLTAKKNEIVKSVEGKGMRLDSLSDSSKFWIRQFESWLSDMKKTNTTITGELNSDTWNEMIKWWGDESNRGKGLEGLFGEVSNAVKAYAQFFFDENDARHNITSWADLKKADISKTVEEKQ